jgi:ArsR family transcriptional regulator
MHELERYFKALADINRLRIINLLLHGELCGCDIQYVLDTSQPNVSRHLIYLKNSGVVEDRRDGFRIFYGLSEPLKGSKRQLFEFLQSAFKGEQFFQADVQRLKEAIKDGACTISEWRPYAAIGKQKTDSGRRV